MNKKIAKYTTYYNKPNMTPEMLDQIIGDCYKGIPQAEVAKKYDVSVGFVSYHKRQYDKNVLTHRKEER